MTLSSLSRTALSHEAPDGRLEWTDESLKRLDQQVEQVHLSKVRAAERRAIAVGADRVTDEILTRSSKHARLRALPLGLSEVLLGWGGGPIITAFAEV